jgi:hypothetical protein
MSPKTLIAALCALIALLAVPAAASAARTNVAVGIGDQAPEMFDQKNFKALKVKKVRYFIRWNAIDDPAQLGAADAYVARAKASGTRVLMHISTDVLVRAVDAKRLKVKAAKLPSVKQYKRKVGALVRRYGGKQLDWGVWNEANHDTQPTYKSPKRAAQFFLAMRSMCKGCTIVALDVLDQAGVNRYIDRFYGALGKKKGLAKLVGIHNYSDTNRRRSTGTQLILRTVKRHNRRADFWLTETGGIAKFGRQFPCSSKKPGKAEKRQANAVKYMFTLTRKFRRDIKRLYVYNYTGADCKTRFDAGLVRSNGKPRPAYKVVKNALKTFKR